MSDLHNISQLVDGFRTNIRALKRPGTQEAAIRQNYIDPFWRLLGWTIGDYANPGDADVLIEKSIEAADLEGPRTMRPDYTFRIHGFPRFIVEAKRPAVDLDTDRDAIFQAKQNAWNSTIPIAILTDFEQFRVFDTTLQPIQSRARQLCVWGWANAGGQLWGGLRIG